MPPLLRASGAGIVVAVGYATIGTTTPWPHAWWIGAYLQWSLIPLIPIAVFAAVLDLLGQRYPQLAARADSIGRRRLFPIEASITAAIGMAFLQLNRGPTPYFDLWYQLVDSHGYRLAGIFENVAGRGGGILFGTAIAPAATTGRTRIFTIPVAITIAAVIDVYDLTTQLGVAFVAAASLWWAVRLTRSLWLLAADHRPRPAEPTSS